MEVSPIKVVTVAVQDEDYGEEGDDMIECNEDFDVINLKVLKILRIVRTLRTIL